MKTIVVCFCALYLVTLSVVRADDIILTCLESLNIRPLDVPQLLLDRSDEAARKRGCIEACVMERFGLMNGNTINMQQLDATIDEMMHGEENKEQLRQSVHECAANAANEDKCLVAQKFAKCGSEHIRFNFEQLASKVAAQNQN